MYPLVKNSNVLLTYTNIYHLHIFICFCLFYWKLYCIYDETYTYYRVVYK